MNPLALKTGAVSIGPRLETHSKHHTLVGKAVGRANTVDPKAFLPSMQRVGESWNRPGARANWFVFNRFVWRSLLSKRREGRSPRAQRYYTD